MKQNNFNQFSRFASVGVVNTAIDLAVLNLLILITHRGRAGAYFVLFKAISFLAAVVNSYFMNARWTFHGASLKNPAQWFRFLFITLVGLIINVAVASSIASFLPSARLAPYWPSISAIAGTSCSFVWNFIGYKRLVFFEDGHPMDLPIQLGLHSDGEEDSLRRQLHMARSAVADHSCE